MVICSILLAVYIMLFPLSSSGSNLLISSVLFAPKVPPNYLPVNFSLTNYSNSHSLWTQGLFQRIALLFLFNPWYFLPLYTGICYYYHIYHYWFKSFSLFYITFIDYFLSWRNTLIELSLFSHKLLYGNLIFYFVNVTEYEPSFVCVNIYTYIWVLYSILYN